MELEVEDLFFLTENLVVEFEFTGLTGEDFFLEVLDTTLTVEF